MLLQLAVCMSLVMTPPHLTQIWLASYSVSQSAWLHTPAYYSFQPAEFLKLCLVASLHQPRLRLHHIRSSAGHSLV